MNGDEFKKLKEKAERYDALEAFCVQLIMEVREANNMNLSSYFQRRYPEIQQEAKKFGISA
jgi:hypothetical protein